MRVLAAIAAALLSGSALAAEEHAIAVVAFGDCRDATLLEATRLLRQEIASRPGARTLPDEALVTLAGGPAGPSAAEVRRALEAGKAAFLNLDTTMAEKTLREVLPEIDRLPLGPQRWDAYWETRAWLARVLQYTNQKPKAIELLLQVLRINEEFQLNHVDFPPSARDTLELARSVLPGLPHFKLSVTSKTGHGQVYLNGIAVGQVPFEKKIAGGNYEVVVTDGAKRSFSRQLVLGADASITADVERESGLDASGPCYRSKPEREERLAGVTFLASALGVEQIVAVRLDVLGSEEYVAAALVEVPKGREVREGRVRRESGKMPSLAKLAQFALTGEGSSSMQRADNKVPAQALAKPEPLVESTGPGASDASSLISPWQRPVSYALFAVAIGLAAGAIYEEVHAGDLDQKASAFVCNQSVCSPQYYVFASSASTARDIRTGLAVASGVVAVGGGAMLVWSFHPFGGGTQASVAVAGNF